MFKFQLKYVFIPMLIIPKNAPKLICDWNIAWRVNKQLRDEPTNSRVNANKSRICNYSK